MTWGGGGSFQNMKTRERNTFLDYDLDLVCRVVKRPKHLGWGFVSGKAMCSHFPALTWSSSNILYYYYYYYLFFPVILEVQQ